MTKKFIGKSPNSSKQQVGNSDCVVNEIGAAIIPMVEKFVHAVRCEDTILEVQQDTMYVNPTSVNLYLDVIKTIDTKFDHNAPGYYEEMNIHINHDPSCSEFFNLSGIHEDKEFKYKAIRINVNGHTAGYYLPEKNSWITGFWTWHLHYITIVLGQVFPQMLEKLEIKSCENAIYAGNKKSIKRVNVSMGCDPEFEVLKNGRVVNAESVISTRDHLSSQIGLDGARTQLEFRPAPGTPKDVMKNIKKLVNDFSKKYPDYDLSDQGNLYPLGGHIHVGVGRCIEIPSDLRTILDDFVGRPTIDMSGEARRTYRELGAIRGNSHGFEYRTTPAAVFQNPAITFIVLQLVKNLCERYFSQEEFEYENVPTIQDYIKIGGLTNNQAKYFLKFCGNYKSQKSIRSSWKVPSAPIKNIKTHSLKIEFRDDWYSGVAEQITREFDRNAIETIRPIKISFYGLKPERGESSCTIPMGDLKTVSGPKPLLENDTLNIGFGIHIRLHTGIGHEKRRILVTTIREYLKTMEVLA